MLSEPSLNKPHSEVSTQCLQLPYSQAPITVHCLPFPKQEQT